MQIRLKQLTGFIAVLLLLGGGCKPAWADTVSAHMVGTEE